MEIMKSRIIIAVHNGKCVIYWCLDSLALDGFYLIHLLYCKIQTTLSFIIFEVTTTYFETTINCKSVHKYDDSPRYKYKLSIWTIGPHSNDDDEWYNCQKCVRMWTKKVEMINDCQECRAIKAPSFSFSRTNLCCSTSVHSFSTYCDF